MSGDRTEGDRSPEDAPDWFDAGDEDATTASGGSDGSDAVRTGGWFDDPDHRPIETVTGSPGGTTDGPATPVLDGATDDKGARVDTPDATDATTRTDAADTTTRTDATDTTTRTDATVGATGEASTETDGTSEGVASESAAAADEPGVGAGDRESGSAAEESGPADQETDPGDHESGPADDRSNAVATPPRSDDRGKGTAETDDTDDTDDTGSLVHRVLAWLRSVVGRSS